MTTRLPVLCGACTRYRKGDVCEAFPRGIPDDIIRWGKNHQQSYPGDNGIRFNLDPDKQRQFDDWSAFNEVRKA